MFSIQNSEPEQPFLGFEKPGRRGLGFAAPALYAVPAQVVASTVL